MWFSAIKLALNAGSHIYKKRQETKMAMADAQHMHAVKMSRGEEDYQGKLVEARQNDYKDEIVLQLVYLFSKVYCRFSCFPSLFFIRSIFSKDLCSLYTKYAGNYKYP